MGNAFCTDCVIHLRVIAYGECLYPAKSQKNNIPVGSLIYTYNSFAALPLYPEEGMGRYIYEFYDNIRTYDDIKEFIKHDLFVKPPKENPEAPYDTYYINSVRLDIRLELNHKLKAIKTINHPKYREPGLVHMCYISRFAYCYPKHYYYNDDRDSFYHFFNIGVHINITDYMTYENLYRRRRLFIKKRIERSKQALLTMAKNYIKRKKNKLLNDTIGVTYGIPEELTALIGTYL